MDLQLTVKLFVGDRVMRMRAAMEPSAIPSNVQPVRQAPPHSNTPSMMNNGKYVLMFEPATWQSYEINPVSELF